MEQQLLVVLVVWQSPQHLALQAQPALVLVKVAQQEPRLTMVLAVWQVIPESLVPYYHRTATHQQQEVSCWAWAVLLLLVAVAQLSFS